MSAPIRTWQETIEDVQPRDVCAYMLLLGSTSDKVIEMLIDRSAPSAGRWGGCTRLYLRRIRTTFSDNVFDFFGFGARIGYSSGFGGGDSEYIRY